MSDFITSNSMIMLQRAVNFQWTKQQALLDNISNAETPNYKVKYVTFEEALNASILSSLRMTDRRASTVRAAISASRPVIHVAENESMRMDENGVDIAEQELEATRNAYQMEYTIDAINRELTTLRSLIKGQ